jgi:hypothetical protein
MFMSMSSNTFGFRVQGLKLRVWGLGLQDMGLKFGVPGFGV